MTDVDDWDDDYESPEEYEAAQRRAEEPPDSYFEQEAEEARRWHSANVHGGGECDCPLPEWPEPAPCRPLFRLPRWSPRKGWRVGTPGACDVTGYRSLRAALRVHRAEHESPF